MFAWIAKLWGWFSGSSIGKYLIEGLLLIGSIGALYAKVRLDGEQAQKGKDAQAELKDVKTASKVQADVAQKSDHAAAQELAKSKWNTP